MTETVESLANKETLSPAKVLAGMQEAGLPHKEITDTVSVTDKKKYMQHAAGRDQAEGKKEDSKPEKLRLSRRKVEETTLKARDGTKVALTMKRSRKRKAAVKPEQETQAAAAIASAKAETTPEPPAKEQQPDSTDTPAAIQAQPTADVTAAADAQQSEAADTQTEEQKAQEQPERKAPAELEALNQVELARREAQKKTDAIAKANLQTEKEHQQKTQKLLEDDDEQPKRKQESGKQASGRKPKAQRKYSSGQLTRNSSDELTHRSNRGRKKRQKLKRTDEMAASGVFAKPSESIAKEIEVPATISGSELAKRMSVKAKDLLATLMSMGVMKTIDEPIDQDTAMLVIEEMGHKAKTVSEKTIEEEHAIGQALAVNNGQPRAPIVTIMGHVDHGKTSLLDYIRKTRITSTEAGGITQHIGAYHAETSHGGITFLDTPGHADFTAMRARGAKLTDLVVLVVAANDGVMPQTIEAIQHAKSAGVPTVVAINKIDLEDANPDNVKTGLAAQDLVPEDWGGKTQCIPISATTGQGVDDLLEAIVLQAELLELKATADAPGRGHVIESRLHRGSGPIASLLINNGRLNVGDTLVAGESFGRIRAMMDEHGRRIQSAEAAMPVEVLGLDCIPEMGEGFAVIKDEKKAKELVEFRRHQSDSQRLASQPGGRLEDVFKQIGGTEKVVLNLILKTDVRGSLEAIEQSIHKLNSDEVQVNIVGRGVGGITESEALFAQTAQAILFGFNVRADAAAKKIIEKYSIEVRYYSVIYELVDDLKVVLSGMLAPELSEEIVGTAAVRDIFNSQRFGLIAGCLVTTGSVHRSKAVRVLRDDVVIYKGELESLRRVKEDVEEVQNGTECGIGIRNYKDVRIGDVIEVFDVHEIARSL